MESQDKPKPKPKPKPIPIDGLTATWTIVCTGCGKTVQTTLSLRESIAAQEKPGEVHTTYSDPWGPGIPTGWIQKPFDKTINQRYIFFHDKACLIHWYESQGRHAEAEQFRHAVWVA